MSKLNGRSANVAGSSFITSTNTSSAAVSRLPASIGACTRASVRAGVAPRLRAASSIDGVILARPGVDRLQRDGEEAHEVRVDQRGDASR